MPDVLDEIIDSLPPSTIRIILESESDYLRRSRNVNQLLHDTQQVKIRQVAELKRKIYDIKTKTAENKSYMSKLKTELENLKSLKKPEGNELSIRAYVAKINELEAQMKSLTKDHGEIDLAALMNNIEELNKEIEEYKKKIAEAKIKYQCYDGFPPNIEQAKEAIAKVKERIKHNEAIVESFF